MGQHGIAILATGRFECQRTENRLTAEDTETTEDPEPRKAW